MNQLVPEIFTRRARRAMSPSPLDDEVLFRVMTAATFAPSCFNNQPWRLVAVREPESLAKVRDFLSKGNAWALSAPCIVLVTTKLDLDCRLDDGRDYAFFDTGMAVMNLQLQAVKEGLYAHPIAGYKSAEIRQAFGIPDGYVLVTLVVLGYPGDEAGLDDGLREKERSERQRKPLEAVFSKDEWAFRD